MPNPPLPWFKLWGGVTSSSKVAPLSDALFRTWVELLDAASQQPTRHRGRFASRKAAAAIVRRPLAHVAALVTEGLIDETPDGLAMHDWDDWQRWRKEDAMDSRSTTDQLRMDSGSTNGSTLDHPPDERMIDTPPLRVEERRKKRDVETLDERRETEDDEYPPAATRQPPRGEQRRVTIVDEEFRSELEAQFEETFGSKSAVRDVIDTAMSHKARLKCTDQRAYLRGWIRRDALRIPGVRANGSLAVLDVDCTCDEVRANLAINRNSYASCDVHGRVEP